MTHTVLYEDGQHKNVLIEDYNAGSFAVQANQHLIMYDGQGLILDPGGHKVYNKVLSATMELLGGGTLRHIFLSHQDPDIVAAVNGWLMTTDAQAWVSDLWVRFVPHFGLDKLVTDRLHGIPDEGMALELGGVPMLVIPAHFLHSVGNFALYDPISKILYSGDIGASVGGTEVIVSNFDEHMQFMEVFHRRYMTCNAALKAWVAMVRTLDIDIIAPQHGAAFRGKEMCERFLTWLDSLQCGIDTMAGIFKVPSASVTG